MNYVNRVAGISQKYDATLDYGIDMYDNLPYQRDSDICNVGALALFSGHVIKYYVYNYQEEEYLINNKDDEIEMILQKIQEQEQQRLLQQQQPDTIAPPVEGITEEQIQTLLEDSEEEFPEQDPESETPPANAINLNDIEDW